MPRPTFEDFVTGKETIAIIGLGYVGLPLAALFARKFKVIGFDINQQRITELEAGNDRTRELTAEQLAAVREKPETGLPSVGRAKEGNLKPEMGKASGSALQVSGFKSQVSPSSGLRFSTDPSVLAQCRLIIVTVPTPIDDHKNPDLTPLVKASTMLGKHIKPGTPFSFQVSAFTFPVSRFSFHVSAFGPKIGLR